MAKVMISIPEAFLKEIDEAAKQEMRSRSEFLREAVRHYLLSRKGESFLIRARQMREEQEKKTQAEEE